MERNLLTWSLIAITPNCSIALEIVSNASGGTLTLVLSGSEATSMRASTVGPSVGECNGVL